MTLTEYCTGIADAIREVEGSTEAIPAPDHAARIKALGGSDFIEVTMTNGEGEVGYIDENHEEKWVDVGETVTARVFRGAVRASYYVILDITGERSEMHFNSHSVILFHADGGTLTTED